jgi:hypothetical protein
MRRKTMPTLHEIDHTGDTRIKWNPDVEAEVEVARAAYDALKAKKYLTYRIGQDGEREQIHAFEPDAERIIASPQIVGG